MPRWVKRMGLAVLALVLLALIAVAAMVGLRPIVGPRARPVTDRTFEATAERRARGEYLATAVAGCLYCHSEIDWQAPGFPVKPGTEGGGRSWASEGVPFVTAPNITSHKTAGIGGLSDDTVARAVREGIGRDGRALFPIMPYQHFRHMADEDLASTIVYLRTLGPISRELAPTDVPFPLNRLINSGPEPISDPVPAPDRADRLTYGGYLVRIGVCRDCHTPRTDQGEALVHLDLAGGNTLTGPYGTISAPNITQAPSGIPYYSEEVFITMMRTGMVGARKIHDQMPWTAYGKQTDEDLKAMFAYLQTVKPVAHRVDNTAAPTPCPVCGLSHGAGEQNDEPGRN